MSGREPLPYGRQWIDEADVAAVVTCLRGDWLTQGPAVEQFEAAIRHATGAKHAIAVANGTAALHLACLAADVGPGSTAITSTITFVASANAVRYAGGEPTLCDVDPETGLASAEIIDRCAQRLVAAGRAPRVIIPIDFAGATADLVAIREVARRVGALVIEDAAHSLGATSASSKEPPWRAGSCAHSDMAILSFHPVKHITTAEGGAITTNDDALAERLRILRTHGITKDPRHLTRNDGPWYYEQVALGLNYRLSDLQCALGASQMRRLDTFLSRRREFARQYDAMFSSAPFVEHVVPLHVPDGVDSARHLYVLRIRARRNETLEDVSRRRLALFLHLREHAIFPQVHYIPVHTQPDFVRAGLCDGEFPGASELYSGCISLPLFPAMPSDAVERVGEAVASWIKTERPDP